VNRLSELVRLRILPALLVGFGVAIVTFGLVTLPNAAAGPVPSAAPVTVVATPSPSPSPSPSASAEPSPSASPSPAASVQPSPSPSATVPADRVATRVAVPALGIDLPVTTQPGGPATYPACGIAMYIEQLGQPGQGRATYLYAHAREGMFLPLLTQSEIEDGAGMLGMVAQVWTSDDQLFLYEISEVRRHATDLDDAVTVDREQLWLQTSEGPRGTVPKLQVVAELLSSEPADPADAHPTPSAFACD
jgi:hypothetical protein